MRPIRIVFVSLLSILIINSNVIDAQRTRRPRKTTTTPPATTTTPTPIELDTTTTVAETTETTTVQTEDSLIANYIDIIIKFDFDNVTTTGRVTGLVKFLEAIRDTTINRAPTTTTNGQMVCVEFHSDDFGNSYKSYTMVPDDLSSNFDALIKEAAETSEADRRSTKSGCAHRHGAHKMRVEVIGVSVREAWSTDADIRMANRLRAEKDLAAVIVVEDFGGGGRRTNQGVYRRFNDNVAQTASDPSTRRLLVQMWEKLELVKEFAECKYEYVESPCIFGAGDRCSRMHRPKLSLVNEANPIRPLCGTLRNERFVRNVIDCESSECQATCERGFDAAATCPPCGQGATRELPSDDDDYEHCPVKSQPCTSSPLCTTTVDDTIGTNGTDGGTSLTESNVTSSTINGTSSRMPSEKEAVGKALMGLGAAMFGVSGLGYLVLQFVAYKSKGDKKKRADGASTKSKGGKKNIRKK